MKQILVEKSAAFIGHRNIKIDNTIETKCRNEIENLISNHGVNVFLLGSKSNFNELCLNIVMELKKKYKYLKLVYIRAEYRYISEEYTRYLLEFFDDTIFPTSVVGATAAMSGMNRKQFALPFTIALYPSMST